MTNTTITNPSATTYQPEAPGTRRPARTIARAAAGITAGFALGCLAASGVIDTHVSTVVPAVPTAAVAAPVRPSMSPDAIDRWAEHAEAVPAAPSVSPAAAEQRRWPRPSAKLASTKLLARKLPGTRPTADARHAGRA